ncbi:hypothetical protein P8605_00620 [Streptomyces sp. T-3]|nr:hypothetical protein [Streptomyces sp. T-3]
MSDLPLAIALSAGMLAAVNPCGFALLPAYLSLLILGDDTPTKAVVNTRALAATAANCPPWPRRRCAAPRPSPARCLR